MRLDQRGVNLIELVVVLAIVAVTAALAAPYFAGNLKQSRLKGAARNLAADLLWARSQAVDRATDYSVVFDVGSNVYTICRTSAPPCTSDNTEKTVNMTQNYTKQVKFGVGSGVAGAPEGLTVGTSAVTFSSNNITFDYLGRSMNGNLTETGVIYLTHEETKQTYAITVGGSSGRVKVYRWHEGKWE